MLVRRRPPALRRSLPILASAIALLLLVLPQVASAASGDLVWTYSEDSPSHALDGVNMAAPGPNGSLYISADLGDDWNDGADLGLFRLRPSAGTTDPVIWPYSYDNPDFHSADFPIDLLTDASGNALVGGQTKTTTGGMDWIVTKVLGSGVPAWDITYGGPQGLDDWIGDVARDAAGNVYACGSIGVGANDTDGVVVKFRASDGKPLWSYVYTGTGGQQRFFALAVDAERRVYVTGSTTASNGYLDAVLVKVGADGKALWKRHIDGAAHNTDHAEGMGLRDGFVYVAGESTPAGGGTRVFATRYSTGGTRDWLRTWQSSAGTIQQVRDVVVDAHGATLVAGAVLLGDPDAKAFLVKWTASGARAWATTYWKTSTSEPAAFSDIAIDAEGRIWAAGQIGIMDASADGLLARYRADGSRAWTRRHDGHEHKNDWFNCVSLWGTAVFAGGVEGTAAGYDDLLAARYVK